MNSIVNTIIKFETKLHQIIDLDEIQRATGAEFKKNKPKHHEEIQNLASDLMAAVKNYFELIRQLSTRSLNLTQEKFIEHQISYCMPYLVKKVEECNLRFAIQSRNLATMKPSKKFVQEINYIKQNFKEVIRTVASQHEQTQKLFGLEVHTQDQSNENVPYKDLFVKHFFNHLQDEENLAKMLKKSQVDYQEAYNRRSAQIFADFEQQILFEAIQAQKKEVIANAINAYEKDFFLDGSRNNENKHPFTWASEVEKHRQTISENNRNEKESNKKSKSNSFSIVADSGQTITNNFFKNLQKQNYVKKNKLDLDESDPTDKFSKLRLLEPAHDSLVRDRSIEGKFVKDFTVTSLSLAEGSLLNNNKIILLNLKMLAEQQKLKAEDWAIVFKNAIQHSNQVLFNEILRQYLPYLTEVSFNFAKQKRKVKIDFACWAAFCGQTEMLETILDKKLFVESNLSSKLLLYIAAGGSTSCFDFYTKKFKQTSKEVWQQATLIALAKGHFALYNLMSLELEWQGINISNCFFENEEFQNSFNLCKYMNKLLALYQSGCVELLQQEQVDITHLLHQIPSAQRSSFFGELLLAAATTKNVDIVTHAVTVTFQALSQDPEIFTVLANSAILSKEMLAKEIIKKVMELPLEQQIQFIEKQSLRALFKFKAALIEFYFDNLLTNDLKTIVSLLDNTQKIMQKKGFSEDIFDKQDKTFITYTTLLDFYMKSFYGRSNSNNQAGLLSKHGKWSSSNRSSLSSGSETEQDSDNNNDNEPMFVQRNELNFDDLGSSTAFTPLQN